MMARNTVMLLGQCQLRPRRVYTDLPIVTKDARWSIDWNPIYAQLVAQCLYYPHCIIHRSELWSKHWCFNWVLPLAKPDYCIPVAKQQYSGLKLSCLSVTSMIHVNEKCVDMKSSLVNSIFPGIASISSLQNYVQSHFWNLFLLMAEISGSKSNLNFECTFKYSKIWNAWWRCPTWGMAR